MKVSISKLLSLICIISLIIIVIYNPGAAIELLISFFVIMAFCVVQLDDEIAILFFSINLIATLNASIFGIPLGSILEIILIVKFLLQNKNNRLVKRLFILIGLLFVCSLSSIVVGYSISRSFVFVINILLMLIVFEYSKSVLPENKEETMKKFFFSYINGFAFTLIVSFLRTDLSRITYYYRFKGLWTDPNFLGFFCAVSISMIIALAGKELKKYIIAIPYILLFLYAGYLTYSRSFVAACLVIGIYITFTVLKSKRIHSVVKIIELVLIVALAYLVYKYYLSAIIATRGILEAKGRDITNGRIDDWVRAWNVYTSSTKNYIFGIGTYTSHNTIIDICLKYGPIGAILIFAIILDIIIDIRNYSRTVGTVFKTSFKLIIVVVLLYIFTLPMLDDDVVYLLLGTLPIGLIQTHDHYVKSDVV